MKRSTQRLPSTANLFHFLPAQLWIAFTHQTCLIQWEFLWGEHTYPYAATANTAMWKFIWIRIWNFTTETHQKLFSPQMITMNAKWSVFHRTNRTERTSCHNSTPQQPNRRLADRFEFKTAAQAPKKRIPSHEKVRVLLRVSLQNIGDMSLSNIPLSQQQSTYPRLFCSYKSSTTSNKLVASPSVASSFNENKRSSMQLLSDGKQWAACN